MQTLRQAMRQFLEGWRGDVAPEWRYFLEGVEPAFDAVDERLTLEDHEIIFPGRKGREPAGAQPGSHIFRALDGLPPGDVRVVIIGQDPYPNVEQATGRAFDQGDRKVWIQDSKPRSPTNSLRRILQQLAVFRTGQTVYGKASGGWGTVKDDIVSGDLVLQAPGALFDHWQAQGALLLNAGLTITRFQDPHQQQGHIPLWKPVVGAICKRLAERRDVPVVFICWGTDALKFLVKAGVLKKAASPFVFTPGLSRASLVFRNHPATTKFLEGDNLFAEVNGELGKLGGAALDW